MQTTIAPVDSIQAPPRNARKHPDNQIHELARALKMFGQTRPVVVDENFVVLAGNGLVAAMQSLGWQECSVYVVEGLTQEQKDKLMLSDNKIFELGVNDYDMINDILKGLPDFDVPGFDPAFLEDISKSLEAATSDHLDEYGKLPDDAEKGEDIPDGDTEPVTQIVTCPECGHTFAR